MIEEMVEMDEPVGSVVEEVIEAVEEVVEEVVEVVEGDGGRIIIC